jgi:hypothetical protein
MAENPSPSEDSPKSTDALRDGSSIASPVLGYDRYTRMLQAFLLNMNEWWHAFIRLRARLTDEDLPQEWDRKLFDDLTEECETVGRLNRIWKAHYKRDLKYIGIEGSEIIGKIMNQLWGKAQSEHSSLVLRKIIETWRKDQEKKARGTSR